MPQDTPPVADDVTVAALTWAIWGVALLPISMATILVVALHPVPGQHAIVPSVSAVACGAAGFACHLAWRHAGGPGWFGAALAVGGFALVFVAAAIHAAWAAVFGYGQGHEVAPIVLVGVTVAAGLVVVLRAKAPVWPGLAGVLVASGAALVAWYVPQPHDKAALLFGGVAWSAAPTLILLLVAACLAWLRRPSGSASA